MRKTGKRAGRVKLPPQPRNSRTGQFAADPAVAQRDAEACRLRAEGLTYREIAERLGYSAEGAAHNAVSRAMDTIRREPAEHLLKQELMRLDAMTVRLVEIARTRHYAVSQGRVVTDPASGEPLIDHEPVIHAIAELRRVGESRRRLLGMDAPARSQVTVSDDQVLADLVALAESMPVHQPGQQQPARPALPPGTDASV